MASCHTALHKPKSILMNHTHTQRQQTAAAFCLQSGHQQQQRYICFHMHSDFTQAQPNKQTNVIPGTQREPLVHMQTFSQHTHTGLRSFCF